MTFELSYRLGKLANIGFIVCSIALTSVEARSQTTQDKLVGNAATEAKMIRTADEGPDQSTLEDECSRLKLDSDSGRETEAEFEVDAKRMLALLGDSKDHDFCRGKTLSYLAAALSRQGKLDEARKAARDSIELLQRPENVERGKSDDALLRQSIGVLAWSAIRRNNMAEAARQAARLRPLAASEKTLALETGLWMSIALHRNQLTDAVRLGNETIGHWERAGYQVGDMMENDLIRLGVALVLSKRPSDAISFLARAIEMSERVPAYSNHAEANALMGWAQWQAKHELNIADRFFRNALYWVGRVPEREKDEVGREVYNIYFDYLQATGRRKQAQIVRAKLDSFGPDPARFLIDYSGASKDDR